VQEVVDNPVCFCARFAGNRVWLDLDRRS